MASLPPPPPPPTGTRTTTTRRTTSRSTSSRTSQTLADAKAILAQKLIYEWRLPSSALSWAYLQFKAGHSVDAIMANLQQRPEFKRRFPGMDARRKAGFGSISVDDYIQTERAYKQIFRNAGLPKGYFDQPKDFATYIGNDVSPSELSNRVQDVYEAVKTDMPQVRQQLASYYGVAPDDGALLAYALNPKKGLDIISRQVQAAEIGGAAAVAGLSESRARAEQLLSMGVSQKEAQQGFGGIAAELGTEARQVGATQGLLSQQQLEQEAFAGDQTVAAKRKRRAQEAGALFGGGGGAAASQQGVVALGTATNQ